MPLSIPTNTIGYNNNTATFNNTSFKAVVNQAQVLDFNCDIILNNFTDDSIMEKAGNDLLIKKAGIFTFSSLLSFQFLVTGTSNISNFEIQSNISTPIKVYKYSQLAAGTWDFYKITVSETYILKVTSQQLIVNFGRTVMRWVDGTLINGSIAAFKESMSISGILT